MTRLETVTNWLNELFSEPDGTPSSRRVCFAIVLAFVLGLVTAALFIQRALSPESVDLLKTALYTTAAALGIGKFAEASK